MEALQIVNEFLKRDTSAEERKQLVKQFGEDLLALSIFACISTDVLNDSQQVELKHVKDYVDLNKFAALIKELLANISEPRVMLSFLVLLREVPEVAEQVKGSNSDMTALLNMVDIYDFILSIHEGLASNDTKLVDRGCAGVLSVYKKNDVDQASFMMCVAAVLIKFSGMDMLLVLRDIIQYEACSKSMPEVLALGMAIAKADGIRADVGAEFGNSKPLPSETKQRVEGMASRFLSLVNESIVSTFHDVMEGEGTKSGGEEAPTTTVNKTMAELKKQLQ